MSIELITNDRTRFPLRSGHDIHFEGNEHEAVEEAAIYRAAGLRLCCPAREKAPVRRLGSRFWGKSMPTTGQSAAKPHPRIFISYSHDSPAHDDVVLALAAALRRRGFDAWIDQYEECPSQGWPRWCREQCEQAEFIVAVCTPTYRQRFEGSAAAGTGRGVSWEGFVLTNEIYDAQGRNERVVPVLPSDGRLEDVPVELRGGNVYSLEDQAGLERLCRRLFRNEHVEPAPLLHAEPLALKSRRTMFEAQGPAASVHLRAALDEQWSACAKLETAVQTFHKLWLVLRISPEYFREVFDRAGPSFAEKTAMWLRRQVETHALRADRERTVPAPLETDRTLLAARALAAGEGAPTTDERHYLLAILDDEKSVTMAMIRKTFDGVAAGSFEALRRSAAETHPTQSRRSSVSTFDVGSPDGLAHSSVAPASPARQGGQR